MIYEEFLKEVRDDLEDNLNAFLTGTPGLTAVTEVTTDGFTVTKRDRSIAVYAYSPNGPIMEYDGVYCTVSLTIEFFLNDSVDTDQDTLAELEKYFSALAFYITRKRYGGNGIITNSQLSRMDQGDPCNECLFLVESRIDTSMDYETTYPQS